jgi:phosphoglycerate dehydrogenase-like enzyme
MTLDPMTLSEDILVSIEQDFLSDASFTVPIMTKASRPVGLMAGWIMAVAKVARIGFKMGYKDAERKWKANLRKLGLLENEHGEFESPELAQMRQNNEYPTQFRVSRVGGIFGPHVAEYVLGRVISIERHFPMWERAQKTKQSFQAKQAYSYRSVGQLKIGVMGASGDVGSAVCKIFKSLGATVAGLSSKRRNKTHNVDEWFNSSDKNGMISFVRAHCDYLINCLPNTKATEHLLDAQLLFANKADKKSRPFLIQVGAPLVTSEAEIVKLMTNKKAGGGLRGVCIDTFKDDELPESSPLWDLPNVMITPHVAAVGGMCAPEIADIFVKNLAAYMEQKPIEFEVHLPHLDAEKKKAAAAEATGNSGGGVDMSLNSNKKAEYQKRREAKMKAMALDPEFKAKQAASSEEHLAAVVIQRKFRAYSHGKKKQQQQQQHQEKTGGSRGHTRNGIKSSKVLSARGQSRGSISSPNRNKQLSPGARARGKPRAPSGRPTKRK